MSGTQVPDSARTAGPDERAGRGPRVRYVYLLAAMGPLSVVILTPAAAAFFELGCARATLEAWRRTLAFAVPLMGLVAAVTAALNAWAAVPLVNWMRSGRPADEASSAARAVLSRMPRAVVLGSDLVLITALASTCYGLVQIGETGPEWIVAGLAATTLLVLTGAVLHYLAWHRLLRPVTAELAAQLGARAPDRDEGRVVAGPLGADEVVKQTAAHLPRGVRA